MIFEKIIQELIGGYRISKIKIINVTNSWRSSGHIQTLCSRNQYIVDNKTYPTNISYKRIISYHTHISYKHMNYKNILIIDDRYVYRRFFMMFKSQKCHPWQVGSFLVAKSPVFTWLLGSKKPLAIPMWSIYGGWWWIHSWDVGMLGCWDVGMLATLWSKLGPSDQWMI